MDTDDSKVQQEEEYEILPHQLLSDLKYDVEALKKKLTQPDTKMNELILEIESMKDAVHDLTNIFTKALEATKGEDLQKMIETMHNRLETITTQTDTMAKSVSEISAKMAGAAPAIPAGTAPAATGAQQPVGQMPSMATPPPLQGNPARTAPMPQAGGFNLPPPPPPHAKKRGLF